MIVDSHFKVSTFLDERFNWKTEHTITFVGTELDRKIAVYVFAFLVGHENLHQWLPVRFGDHAPDDDD